MDTTANQRRRHLLAALGVMAAVIGLALALWGCAPHAPRPRGTPPWESHARPPSRTGSQRSGAAGLSRAKAPAAPPTRHPRKTRGRALRKPGLAEMAAFAFVKPAPPGPPRADRHPSGCKPGLRAAATGNRVGMIAQPSGARAATTAVAARGGAPRAKGIKTRVSYAGECSLEEAVSQYLAARANSRAIPALAEAGA